MKLNIKGEDFLSNWSTNYILTHPWIDQLWQQIDHQLSLMHWISALMAWIHQRSSVWQCNNNGIRASGAIIIVIAHTYKQQHKNEHSSHIIDIQMEPFHLLWHDLFQLLHDLSYFNDCVIGLVNCHVVRWSHWFQISQQIRFSSIVCWKHVNIHSVLSSM